MRRIRPRLTYANVMVTILAFIVLGGGTALASFVVSSNTQIGPGTVSGHKPPAGKHSNLIGGSVNGTDLAPAAVSTAKLANGSVSNAKLQVAAVGSTTLANGAVTGPKLADTAINASKLGLASNTATTATNSTSPKSQSVNCPAGTTVIGGSVTIDDGSGGDPGPVALSGSGLGGFLNGWHASAYESSAIPGDWELVVTALCMRG
jgi:hypothetical protein